MVKKTRGVLVAFEGLDGSGKSTQIQLAHEKIAALGVEVVSTREPTDGPYGQKIRQLFVDRTVVSNDEELALFMADRKEHVAKILAPSLARGAVVLTDRYYFSTAAYQGAAGLDPKKILSENETFAPRPDMVIFIGLPVEESMRRIQESRGDTPNAFEQEQELRKVQELFDGFQDPCFKRIDGTKSIEEVHTSIMMYLDSLIQNKG